MKLKQKWYFSRKQLLETCNLKVQVFLSRRVMFESFFILELFSVKCFVFSLSNVKRVLLVIFRQKTTHTQTWREVKKKKQRKHLMGFVQLLFKDREIRLNIRETAFREAASRTMDLLVWFSSYYHIVFDVIFYYCHLIF